ncbi:hypothetical protein [Paenibacillus larvae]|uniref:Uncharacterized protein n=1 Tax=Paenibacillus larvae subsp. larvae DSM 25430 TaxID=697284 RepID=V9W507_9BACL|nr:hypothetical protein [Paenibacillus larvae]AHD04720.1 hypothetical protein ERIC2_c08870 [Paenibacillus larvae subsp. larvae DSM 25430]MDR5566948.1 hypothetical protein [Paenibacillus larvae]MDR5595057.1 hypothetical protein [Paenibacillus larvae]
MKRNVWIVVLSLLVISLGVMNYRNLQEIRSLENEISSVKSKTTSSNPSSTEQKTEATEDNKPKEKNDAQKVNAEFIKAFFEYDDLAAQIEKVKKLTTERGLLKAYPSGTSTERSGEVVTKIGGVETFEKLDEKDNKYVEYINEFNQTISFGGKKNRVKRIVKTGLKLVDGTWKVNNVELMNQ